MSQWDNLVANILAENKNLRFEELAKALIKIGYTMEQPRGGSSHYTFRKSGYAPITIPKHEPIKRVYVEQVRKVVEEENSDEIV